jgi:hypothetical protein
LSKSALGTWVNRSISARTPAVNLSGRSKTGVDHDRPRIGLNSAEF